MQFRNNGKIAPGAVAGTPGTLTATGDVTNAADSHWAIELNGAAADKLAVGGNLDLLAVDSLDITGAGTGSSWVIATYVGTLAGTFDFVTSGYTVDYGSGTNSQITLNVAVGFPGDFNSDGKVDAGDYVTWRKNDGTNNALANDGGLGTPVGSAHYNLWRQKSATRPAPVVAADRATPRCLNRARWRRSSSVSWRWFVLVARYFGSSNRIPCRISALQFVA